VYFQKIQTSRRKLMNYHLLKDDGEWQLREQGSRDVVFAAETKSEALQKLTDYMDSRDGSVSVHTVDGRIQEHRSYANEGDTWLAGMHNVTKWSIIGVAAVAAVTAAGVAWYFRAAIPTERLRFLK
jgi:hypothetical protein